ncbi:hypothetical protein HDU76_004765 [Blyttiomyces sp. JEL0837]|nr:hypothetical protein HDU76_004765 [Blyttiomyces sp. JEL0837]
MFKFTSMSLATIAATLLAASVSTVQAGGEIIYLVATATNPYTYYSAWYPSVTPIPKHTIDNFSDWDRSSGSQCTPDAVGDIPQNPATNPLYFYSPFTATFPDGNYANFNLYYADGDFAVSGTTTTMYKTFTCHKDNGRILASTFNINTGTVTRAQFYCVVE